MSVQGVQRSIFVVLAMGGVSTVALLFYESDRSLPVLLFAVWCILPYLVLWFMAVKVIGGDAVCPGGWDHRDSDTGVRSGRILLCIFRASRCTERYHFSDHSPESTVRGWRAIRGNCDRPSRLYVPCHQAKRLVDLWLSRQNGMRSSSG